jgi:hypothetical protein
MSLVVMFGWKRSDDSYFKSASFLQGRGTEDETQDLVHMRQVLYHGAAPPAQDCILIKKK